MSTQFLRINGWLVHGETGDLWEFTNTLHDSTSIDPKARLEPKSVHLLFLLATQPQTILSKDKLISALWPTTIVTEDALTRCVSRLRKALLDDPKQPRVIETLPKRGYRLVAATVQYFPIVDKTSANADTANHRDKNTQRSSDKIASSASVKDIPGKDFTIAKFSSKWLKLAVVVLILIGAFLLFIGWQQPLLKVEQDDNNLISQADDYYLQIRRQDNEMAIKLYEQAIALKPESGSGLAGLANALVQQVIRWPSPVNEPELPLQNLQQALQEQRHRTPQAMQKLNRALAMAEKAVRLSPKDARTHKSLGFVYSARAEFDLALASYYQAVELDKNAWDALINIGDVLEITDKMPKAVEYYELAFEAMGRVYNQQTARIRPWYADLGSLIGDKYVELKKQQEAEVWYRHVLGFAPFNLRAAQGLTSILIKSGDTDGAQRICSEFLQRIGKNPCSD
jgi:DNA-binding winged helix-turn-helix (wHTH) protein/Tfp pilus assembly protein PilF